MMYVFSSFPLQWIFSRLLINVLIIIVLLVGASGTENVHAASGSAYFMIAPGSIPHSNAAHRRYFTYNSQPGMLFEDSVNVTNTGTARGSVDLYAVDATTSQTSGATFLAPSDPRRDIGAWIMFSSRRITLNPGQSQEVPFSLHVPNKVRAGQHGGGIIAADAVDQAVSPTSRGVHSILQLHWQKIISVLVNLPGTIVERLNVTGAAYDGKGMSQRLLIGLSNTGTQILHPSGNLLLTDTKGRLLQSVPLKLEAILPQTAINYPVTINPNVLHSGKYHTSIFLEYEGGHSTKYGTSFVVSQTQAAMSQIISKSVADRAIPRAISNIATSKSNPVFFNALMPWYYIVGLFSLILLLAFLVLRGRKLGSLAKLRQGPKL